MKSPVVIPFSSKWLNERLSYNRETGELFWTLRPRSDFPTSKGWRVWTARCAGSSAAAKPGRTDTCPYCRVTINGKKYLAHRVIWLMVHGVLPEQNIGHKNGDGTDNRFSNLALEVDGKRVRCAA